MTAAVAPAPSFAVRGAAVVATVYRVLLGAALAGLGVAAMVRMLDVQFREAALAGWAVELFGRPSRVLTTGPTFLFQKTPGDDSSWAGLVVTASCTAALFVGGTLILGGAFIALWRRTSATRLLAATVLTVLLLVVVNTGRMVMIAEAASRWGAEGFGLMHTVVGSILMLVTFCLCAVLFARVGLLRSRS
ncbi:archaeosortase/exosortase family protein [Oerskovia flava]|uniref:archaeosortase/exosortase family protein n=1 Tax=Oerskovia flava TaxID=2986422 RepID=UPI00223F82D9|nr:archaeosortase/exosortase family protein [Oerskovia sp. JB1-3-2]